VLQLHGSSKSGQDRYRKILADEGFLYDVVVTTYEMVKAPALASSISRLHFNYLVLDEGHKVKGYDTLIAAAVRRVHCENRVLLTGTPLQNNLIELWSLLELLFPDVFTTSIPFAEAFDLKENHVDADMLLCAQKVLDLFMIRRLKSRVEALLPSKLETRIYCPLSRTQVFWYKSILMKDLPKLEQVERSLYSNSGTTGESNNNEDEDEHVSSSARTLLTNLFMQLRKCSQHPFLFPGAESPNLDDTALVDLIAASGKLSVLDMLLRSLFQKKHRVVLFSQFTMVLDLLEDYCVMRGWRSARFDGGTARAKRSFLMNQFNADDSPFFLFLMSTKAGGMGLNLQSADTCILFDSDWNPQNDLQAMARVHRIGQTKKVHIYRLISANTVEERIVERAAKKLLLDQAVNRDSDTSATAASTDEKGTGLSTKALLRDIKFGCQAIFGGQTNMELPSLKEIDEITNRQRSQYDSVGKLTGGTEENGASFDSEKLFTASQTFAGLDYRAIRAKQEQKMKKEIPKTMAGIGRLWNQVKEIQGNKRQVKKRLVMVDGLGSGYGSACVPVLASNNYDLNAGESSVFDRELSQSKKQNFAVPAKKVRLFENASACQVCLDGGRLVCCPVCPVSLHIECIGLSRENDFARCPHHRCIKCEKNGADAGGYLYPCAVCTNSYCDECLPMDEPGFRMLGKNERFEELGYNSTKRTAYIHCSVECEKFAKLEYGWKLEKAVSVCPEPLDVSFNFGHEDELDIGEEIAAEESADFISSEGVRKPRRASIAAKEMMKMTIKKEKKIPGQGSNPSLLQNVVKSSYVRSNPHQSANATQQILNHND
jgi:SWI/SNF-related matrix-associated actin-dependent regulator of chromatin subfamily A member 5